MPRRIRGPRARDIAVSSQAYKAFSALEARNDATSRSIIRRIRALRSALRSNALHGEPVKKAALDRRPAAPLVRRHGLDNCFCVDLPDGWRLLYTIVRDEQKVHIVVVEIVDHATYDKWFPGRGR